MLGVFLKLLFTLVFEIGSLTEPGTHDLARLTGLCAPGICLPLLPQPGGRRCVSTPSFMWTQGI